MNRAQKSFAFGTLRYAILLAWLFIVIFPLFWMFATSFKPDHEWFAWPPIYWSETPTWSNYLNVWGGVEEYA